MKTINYKNLLDKDVTNNLIVRVILHADDKKEYECVGVLMKMKEDKDTVRIAFNAKNDKVVDYLDIKKTDIISIDILDNSDIKKLV